MPLASATRSRVSPRLGFRDSQRLAYGVVLRPEKTNNTTGLTRSVAPHRDSSFSTAKMLPGKRHCSLQPNTLSVATEV
jgi:hypothetical protein